MSCDRGLPERRGPKMTLPLVRDLAVDGYPVMVTCRVLGFSTQAYFGSSAIRCASGTGTMLIF